MPEQKLERSRNQTEMLERISMAAGIILWAVLTQILVWPIGAIVAEMRDKPLLSYGVLPIAAVVSAIIAFLICRWVFPASYLSTSKST